MKEKNKEYSARVNIQSLGAKDYQGEQLQILNTYVSFDSLYIVYMVAFRRKERYSSSKVRLRKIHKAAYCTEKDTKQK
jgi:hypothetical protein